MLFSESVNKRLEKEPVRVMHLRASSFLGSPERLILGRLKKMNPQDCEYVVGIFNEQKREGNDFYHALKEFNINSYLLHDSMVFFLLNIITTVRKIKEFRPQIICTHDYKSNFYGLLLGKMFRIATICTFHGRTKTDFKIAFYHMIDNGVLKLFDAIVCVSEEMREKFKRFISEEKLYVVPNAVDVDEIEQLSEKNAQMNLSTLNYRKHNIIFAGRLSKEKGLLYLIEAAEILLKKYSDLNFLIIGEGPEKEHLRKVISEKQLGYSIHLLGFKKNVYPYLKNADFLVLPSLTEGMPVVILEALALGKPVVATNVGGIPEIIRNGFNGIIVNPRDVNAIAQSMDSLLMDPRRSSEMGKNGCVFVKENHTFDDQVQKYLSVYEAVIQKRAN